MACLYYKVKQGQEKVLSHETVLFVTASLRDVMTIINMKIHLTITSMKFPATN